jgi:hypothetical protein
MKFEDFSLTNPANAASDFPKCMLRIVATSPSVYLSLKERFGVPNGTGIRNIEHVQWAYILKYGENIFNVHEFQRDTCFVEVYSQTLNEDEATKLGNDFKSLLEQEKPRWKLQIREVAASANRFVVVNPYRVCDQSARFFEQRANETNGTESSHHRRAAFFLLFSALEGLLNLLYELYLKPELRDDEIARSIARFPLEQKIRLAPLYCTCFTGTTISKSEEALQRFFAIREIRNDAIHGNLKRKMFLPVIEIDGYRFVVPIGRDNKYNLQFFGDYVYPDTLEFLKETVTDLKEMLIQRMRPNDRHHFERALLQKEIEIQYEGGEAVFLRDQPK